MAIYDLLDKSKYVSKREYLRRLSLCNSCPERLEHAKNKKLTKFSTCPECGCLNVLKAKLVTEDCPLGDW